MKNNENTTFTATINGIMVSASTALGLVEAIQAVSSMSVQNTVSTPVVSVKPLVNHTLYTIDKHNLVFTDKESVTGLTVTKKDGTISYYKWYEIIKQGTALLKVFGFLNTELSKKDKDGNYVSYVYSFDSIDDIKQFETLFDRYIRKHVVFSDDTQVTESNGTITSVKTPVKDTTYTKRCAALEKARNAKKSSKRIIK